MSTLKGNLADQQQGSGDIYQKHFDHDVSSIQTALNQYLEYKTEYHNLQTTLLELPDEIEYDAMVPVGPLAFFPGKLIHTNEILVSLGDNWFTERSAKQAAGIAKRREDYVDEKIRDCRRNLKALGERKKLVPEIFEDEKEQVEKTMFNEDGEEIVDIKEELDAEQVPDFYEPQSRASADRMTKSEKEALEAKRSRVIQSLSSSGASSKGKLALGAEEQRIMDLLGQFDSDDEGLDEGASDDERNSSDEDEDGDEDGDAFSDEDRANAAQDDDEDDYNDHPSRQHRQSQRRLSDDEYYNDIGGNAKLNVVERYRNPVSSSPLPRVDGGHKGILKKSTSLSLFKNQKAGEAVGAGKRASKSVSFNLTAVAYTQPSQDLLDDGNVDEDVSRVANLLSTIGMSGQDKVKAAPKIAVIDDTTASSSKPGSAAPVVGKFKPNVPKSVVRSWDNAGSSSSAKPKTPNAQQPLKSAVVERSAVPSDTNQDIVDEDMHAREIAQTYNRMRLAKLVSGNLDEAAEVAERILATTPGVTLIESKAPKDDDNVDSVDADGYERIELPEDPSSLSLGSVGLRPPEVIHEPRQPPRTPATVQSSEPETQQPTKPKMSRFKAQRLGLEE
ncbi:hypothetical protein IWW37_005484 [Coemansia sp. RSA 2050]|nr:hypothetical protein IWW37_005484 [Coemansia sp. RSA 2050]KAJ2730034.1 hypothetical protein IW152_005407 [Coemansia sp. BCRC 34962]